VRVLTWNLYHGRSRPPSGRSLLKEFAAALDGWEWDVALLQEVPPWWPPMLAQDSRAHQRTQLTSRNWLLPVRRAISERNPDILKSHGGGANAILVRGAIRDDRAVRLRRWPEARWAHGVRLDDAGWAVNVHSQNHPEAAALADTRRAIEAAREWAAGVPLIFGGDINLKRPPEFPGLVHLGGNHVDHLFSDGRPPAGRPEVLERGPLSDHPPVAVTLAA
jgi:endonuclease/exonuclease/phosphatase family metal-dependent hydrolase